MSLGLPENPIDHLDPFSQQTLEAAPCKWRRSRTTVTCHGACLPVETRGRKHDNLLETIQNLGTSINHRIILVLVIGGRNSITP